jgi:glyoxylase-like metal-dependent hydrolase (beta-lactamase superfamily II)
VPYETLELGDYKVRGVFCTHAHYDHILEADNIISKSGSILLAHSAEIPAFKDTKKNGSSYFGKSCLVESPVCVIKDGDVLTSLDFEMTSKELFTIRIIHTPGHTTGSICVLFESMDNNGPRKHLFSGDTVFAGTIGRTDIGGSLKDMKNSISKIATLSNDVIIYPGHGDMTSVEQEKRSNPYFTATFYNDII